MSLKIIKIGRTGSRLLVYPLLTEVKKGKKVFAVVGASHVIVQEPALCQFFGVPYK